MKLQVGDRPACSGYIRTSRSVHIIACMCKQIEKKWYFLRLAPQCPCLYHNFVIALTISNGHVQEGLASQTTYLCNFRVMASLACYDRPVNAQRRGREGTV